MAGTTINSSYIGTGVTLSGNDVLTNTGTGTITNAGVAVFGLDGTAANTVVNAGRITGGTGAGISLLSGGIVTNQATGTIGGNYAVRLGDPGTVVNQGRITASNVGVVLGSGGSVDNQTGGTIASSYRGVQLIGSGSVGNSGLISAASVGIVLNGAGGSAYNRTGGTIISSFDGLYVQSGTVLNQGAITAGRHGMFLVVGGAVTNIGGGSVSASHSGIVVSGGGQVVNAAGGTITARYLGVSIYGGSGTVTNAGTITATEPGTATAVRLAKGFANRLIVNPNAVFNGLVDGANAIGVTQVSTLELASAASAGTLSGIGSKYIRFAAIAVNAGANWTLAGTNSIAAGATLTDSGALTNSGLLTNAGVLNATAGVLINSGSLINRGSLSGQAVMTNNTWLSNASTGIVNGAIYSPGIAGTRTIINAGLITSTGDSAVINLQSGAAVVSNFSTGTIAAKYGLNIGGAVNLTNRGQIVATGPSGDALVLRGTGTVSNVAKATISGQFYGLVFTNGSGTVTNGGSIHGGGVVGVALNGGGSVSNQVGARITGHYSAVKVIGELGTVSNSGSVAADAGSGIVLDAGGSITNQKGGTVTGIGVGAAINGVGGTLTNLGGISAVAGAGVVLGQGGRIINGGSTVTTASIIGGNGNGVLVFAGTATIGNLGTIIGGYVGVNFGTNGTVNSTGTVVNGSTAGTLALITGSQVGVSAFGAVTVTNFGTIKAPTGPGIFMAQGGRVTNGDDATTKASIAGGSSTFGTGIVVNQGTASIGNFGTVKGGATGIAFYGNGTTSAGGSVTNGSTANTTALITGSSNGILAAGAVRVTNLAVIRSATGNAIFLGQGGSVANGGAVSPNASIVSGSGTIGTGIVVEQGSATISNRGTITGGNIGIDFRGNGTVASTGKVTNGDATNTAALIRGTTAGISAQGVVSVTNAATIRAIAGVAVSLGQGGNVINGTTANTLASISAGSGTIGTGVLVGGGSATLTNFGTVKGGNIGVDFGGSGTVNSTGRVFNGDTGNATALISGSVTGISARGSVTVTNFGTVKATAGTGVFMGQGGQLINGGTASTTATISGFGASGVGVRVESGKAVITNFGTVTGAGSVGIQFAASPTSSAVGTVVNAGRITNGAGTAGTAIQFGAGDDRLVLRPGSSLTGKVVGGAGANTLELAEGGAATTGAIGTAFTDFGTVVVDAGANWTLANVNTTNKITNKGTLSLAAGATLQVTGSVDAASNGVFLLQDASTLEVLADKGSSHQMSFIGNGRMVINQAANFGLNIGKKSYTGPLLENFGIGDIIDLKDVLLAGSVLDYSGTTGLLQISNGGAAVATLAFQTSSIGAGTFHAADDGLGHILLTHS